MFRKIPATDAKYIKLKEKYQYTYNDFQKFAQHLTDQAGRSLKSSGKASSYARYLIKLLVLIEEEDGDIINELVSNESVIRLQDLGRHKNFEVYNKDEARFPSATIRCFVEYVNYKYNEKTEQLIDIEFNNKLNEVKENRSYYGSSELIQGPRPRKEKEMSRYGASYPRNPTESIEAKRRNNWTCEVDVSHVTFQSASDNNPYVEAHHLIPMAAQDFYENTIDFADNIVALCPNCHRKIHHAIEEEKRDMLMILFNKHKAMYPSYEIEIDFDTLCAYYS
ncbi:HNH endonuclease [Paenibacillus wenxiniae]|uniref:HNH endonuclease n=1 Tax=Paenibacillus wenxiniae TaxID=1636843 RepID=A0ABW4RIU4_9BACL